MSVQILLSKCLKHFIAYNVSDNVDVTINDSIQFSSDSEDRVRSGMGKLRQGGHMQPV